MTSLAKDYPEYALAKPLLTNGLTPEEWAVVEWQFHMCGGFKAALWDAISRADAENLARLHFRLHLAFPTEVEGFRLFAYEPGWWPKVQQKMKRE